MPQTGFRIDGLNCASCAARAQSSLAAVQGVYDRETLMLIAIALPVAFATSLLGVFTFTRLQDSQFRKLLIAMMFLSGSVLAIRTLT